MIFDELTEKNVLWLDVTVNNVFPVQVAQRICHLVDVLWVEETAMSV